MVELGICFELGEVDAAQLTDEFAADAFVRMTGEGNGPEDKAPRIGFRENLGLPLGNRLMLNGDARSETDESVGVGQMRPSIGDGAFVRTVQRFELTASLASLVGAVMSGSAVYTVPV